MLNLAGRAAKEEQMFSELGYLAPPNPPNELERRRALYKFNIWNTGRDVNFDRIAHLVKLVFNTRIVAISLVDGNELFFKSESGVDAQNIKRSNSFDAHAILQRRDDEPTVILDAQEDWRFAKNPYVIGHPHIRFYAGCPLRTQDGFNIGALSIIDDTPRREFNPRQRHTLKEFAQITMRELELWRDKIQLRIRDRIQSSMEQFTRECLEVDKDADADKTQGLVVGSSMEQIYMRAARLVKRTLDVEGAIVMDVSHVDVLETTGSESSTAITIHDADAHSETVTQSLSKDEYARLTDFFAKYPEGKICEGVYILAVPIFNIDKRPFALLCAYSTGERTTPFLEGHELSYLRAIGVIILSAVLKRRMILADKAKSLFISNISHELRTPLHGILASAELLSDTPLNHSQASFLQTVQACGTSLVETVNHVLDFTKLSGNAKSGGVEHTIQLSKVDLMQLVEEATEGCWIGHRARMFTSEIGSVYSPPKQDRQAVVLPNPTKHVETVIDIQHSPCGWTFLCEKGGIRRILMNVFGNSLKFTSDGYVHVMLRQLGPADDTSRNKVRIELSVLDTGKGISQNFLKNQLFHPFSQENPLQTGTGLGLAIVNSIVRSPGVDGKVDVWSAEGVGTEIRVTFTAEAVEDVEASSGFSELIKVYDHLKRPAISLVGFDDSLRGVCLLREVLTTNLVARWGFTVKDDRESGDIVIVNEDLAQVKLAVENKDSTRPFIILSSARGDPRLMAVVNEYEHIGGFCRIVYKPVGPCRLMAALKLCLHVLNIAQGPRPLLPTHHRTDSPSALPDDINPQYNTLPRRYSEESGPQTRPLIGPRSVTAHPLASWSHMTWTAELDEQDSGSLSDSPNLVQSPSSPTIAIGTGGTLLKSSVGTIEPRGPLRVLVVEDNSILRNLLVKWLRNKGYDFREAVDGLEGVRIFDSDGRFDVVLVDLSMPVLDGVGATAQMRGIESARRKNDSCIDSLPHAARILALTGMSSLEDKRRAFEAGVDGYLVKPVAFKTLDTMIQKLGISS
ncbi:Hybrid signal transduction histidine kinase J [Grifola frondosa]|uniref:histidine kinase n=1 Tax=Grifola frondosa TaxID=5627 RepID=A0A1C7M5I1_GRIFR|nr:Hybrid signal transduction histidine kinase J [Grifola frondosa]